MYLKQVLGLLPILALTQAVLELRYIKNNDEGRNKVELNLTDVYITEKSFKENVWWLLFDRREGGDEIRAISDFSTLAHVNIYNIDQDYMPEFKNLPKIYSISIKGNEITYIKKESLGSIPVKEVFLTNNNISKIEPQSFGSELHTLHLSCNELKRIKPNWFQSAESLKELDISGNEITTIERDLFSSFLNLEQIVLSHNKISQIENYAFGGRDYFRVIKLGYNQLTELSAKIFKYSRIKINLLSLEFNHLSFLTNQFTHKVNATKSNIHGNPWSCECYPAVKLWSMKEDVKDDFDYNYDNTNSESDYDYIVNVKKTPAGVRCMNVTTESCDYTVDFDMIEDYKANNTRRQNRQDFCVKLSKD